MIIQDKIYGKINIKDRVIIDLINSTPLQRLKKIHQYGASHFIKPFRNVTRFEHSIGVWYLSKLYKRQITEQISCLLHDIPHTAFSHVIDHLMKDEQHEFHEKFHEKIILNSEIPEILKKHKIELRNVLNKEKFELLDNTLPDISFDRLDYFMRDSYCEGFLTKSLILDFMNEVKIRKFGSKDVLYFKDSRLAAIFAILFMSCSRLMWLDPESHASANFLAHAIKISLERKIIDDNDLFTNDDFLMDKMLKSKEKEVLVYLNKLKPKNKYVYVKKEDAEYCGPNKPRFVDPLVFNGNKFSRISELVPSLKYYFEEFTQNYKMLGVKQA